MPDNLNQPEGRSRRRIVIPLNREQPGSYSRPGAGRKAGGNNAALGSPRKSRVGRVLAVFGIIIVAIVLLVAGGVLLWWQHYRTTPAYSLALLVDAAQRNDMATVDTIIDTDQIVANFAAQVTDKAASRYGLALGGVARKQIESLAPRMLPTIKQNVRDAVATRVKEISEKGSHKPFVALAVGLPYYVDVTVSGDNARATALVKDQQVELDLRRAGDGWKVIAFRDDALVQRIIDQLIQDLPVIGIDNRKQVKRLPPILPGVRIP